MSKILIVEDKDSMAQMLKETLDAEGFDTLIAPDGKKGMGQLRKSPFDLVLTDLNLPGAGGLDVLRASRDNSPLRPVIVMTAFGSIEVAVEAMKDGAFDFITKPFNMDHLIMLINRALENKRVVTENILMKEKIEQSEAMQDIIGKSRCICDITETVKRVAPSKTTVLLEGKSGTGKELFARAIHRLSDRAKAPFVAINCAAIPRDLLESEFFGHEKGAFTGAEARKMGKFELADGGTLFLDEIGELDKGLQAKLLRVLQEEEIDRVGGNKPIKVDVRVIAASNRDLRQAMENGDFREDLYYRINVFPITIPPLSERREDIPLLAEFLVQKHARKLNTGPKEFSPAAMEMLISHEWKGNIRELENAIERSIILSDSETIEVENLGLPSPLPVENDISAPEAATLEQATKRATREVEERLIRAAMRSSSGNKTKAAAILNVSYKTLLTKIKDYGIN